MRVEYHRGRDLFYHIYPLGEYDPHEDVCALCKEPITGDQDCAIAKIDYPPRTWGYTFYHYRCVFIQMFCAICKKPIEDYDEDFIVTGIVGNQHLLAHQKCWRDQSR